MFSGLLCFSTHNYTRSRRLVKTKIEQNLLSEKWTTSVQRTDHLPLIGFTIKLRTSKKWRTFSNVLSTGKSAKCREALQHIADIAADLLYRCFVFLDFLTLKKKQNSVLHEIGDRQLSSQMRS